MGVWHRIFSLAQIWSAWGSRDDELLRRSQRVLGLRPQGPYSPRYDEVSLLPASGNALWYREPASRTATWSTEWLPIGNGMLGAMIAGGTDEDMIQVNIESFWSGGPFVNASYNGGNHPDFDASLISDKLGSIRRKIFSARNGETDSIAELTSEPTNYGSFSGNGYIVATRKALNSTHPHSSYLRWLDLDSGLIKSAWSEGDARFTREYFCSYPSRSCTAHTKAFSLPTNDPTLSYTYTFLPLPDLYNPTVTCEDASTLRYRGQTLDRGMAFEVLARVQTHPAGRATCRTTIVPSQLEGGKATTTSMIDVEHVTETWVTWVGDTNYNIDAGDEAHGFSFSGPDPHTSLTESLSLATAPTYRDLRQAHLSDYKVNLTDRFSLSLGTTKPHFFTIATNERVRKYTRGEGDPHLEWVLFTYGRYMLFSSGRGVLPANLQGVWAQDTKPAWSADYHANINTQMNYWAAEATDVDVTASLWDYMEKTWVPRGQHTARILYNTTRGWVTHNEMNIFGHTGMKSWGPWNSAIWANYPASAAWMMTHVIDHLEYGSGSLSWWRTQGWPLLKGVAAFWLDNVFVDERYDDGTMVVNPCNSPEQAPITFGCAHYQQLIWELFNGVEKGWEFSGDDDVAFLAEVRAKKARLDRGLHVGSWGQLQEWKVDKDSPTDTHRHLSHLLGLYPSYSIASYPEGGEVMGLSREALLDAAKVSLVGRGDGKGPDADAGWEKVWRAGCWAQLGDGEKFYDVLKYSVHQNFGYNLFSLYDPFSTISPIFQIDANLGYPAVLLNALIQSPSTSSLSAPIIISLLPALPRAWSDSGEIKTARVRGGCAVSFGWRHGRVAGDVKVKCDRWVGDGGRTVLIYEGPEAGRVLLGKFQGGKGVTWTIRAGSRQ